MRTDSLQVPGDTAGVLAVKVGAIACYDLNLMIGPLRFDLVLLGKFVAEQLEIVRPERASASGSTPAQRHQPTAETPNVPGQFPYGFERVAVELRPETNADIVPAKAKFPSRQVRHDTLVVD